MTTQQRDPAEGGRRTVDQEPAEASDQEHESREQPNTTRDGIESWWAPDGFIVEVEKLETFFRMVGDDVKIQIDVEATK